MGGELKPFKPKYKGELSNRLESLVWRALALIYVYSELFVKANSIVK